MESHINAMHRVMAYARGTTGRNKLKLNRKWEGHDCKFKFRLGRQSNSNYATCPDTCCSVSGWYIMLKGCPIIIKSVMQILVVLLVTEAEFFAMVLCVQDLMFMY